MRSFKNKWLKDCLLSLNHTVCMIPTHLPTCLPTYLSTYLPTYPPTYLPTYLSTYLSTYLPSYLPTYLPSYLLTYLPTCLPAHLPTYLPTYLIDDEAMGTILANIFMSSCKIKWLKDCLHSLNHTAGSMLIIYLFCFPFSIKIKRSSKYPNIKSSLEKENDGYLCFSDITIFPEKIVTNI